MPVLKALIFDVDGTLAETEELHRHAFNDAFAAAGLSWSWDQPLYADLLAVTGGKERIRHYMQTYSADKLDGDAIAALHADKTAKYTKLVAGGGITLRPGIERLIRQALAAGLRLAIATTTSRPNVDALLRATLKSQPFEVIAAGDEVAVKKPAPDVYLLALEKLGLPPQDCLAIEDTSNGLISAASAGLACVITTSAYGGKGPFPGALAVIDGFGDDSSISCNVSGQAVSGPLVELSDLQNWMARRSSPKH